MATPEAQDDRCPQCGALLAHGYGLAGGGIGPYVYCTNVACDFFEKTQDHTDEKRAQP